MKPRQRRPLRAPIVPDSEREAILASLRDRGGPCPANVNPFRWLDNAWPPWPLELAVFLELDHLERRGIIHRRRQERDALGRAERRRAYLAAHPQLEVNP